HSICASEPALNVRAARAQATAPWPDLLAVEPFLTVPRVGAKTWEVESIVHRLRASLYTRQLPQGGWPFLRGSLKVGLEPTCLALLALRGEPPTSAHVLLDVQRPDGSWGSFATADEASGLTAPALLTLNNLGAFPRAA